MNDTRNPLIIFIENILNGNFMPHGHCLLWRWDLLLMHVGSDVIIVLSYYAIPFALIYLVKKRKDLAFNWIFVMFGLFIFFCGTTHLVGIINVWHGYYFAEGLVKVATAAVSIATAVLMVPLIPKIMAIPSNAQLAEKNEELHQAKQALEFSNQQLAHEKALLERTEMELRLAQKLEAVGQLAAGVAHEINTPMQFIGDHIDFLKTAHHDLQTLLLKYKELHTVLNQSSMPESILKDIENLEVQIDLPFLQQKCPQAFEKTQAGVERVSRIVQAMKEFAYPSQTKKAAADINQAIENTLIVAKNEYKYIAEVETELSSLPPVYCHIGDLNQVFLNLIVNAAHAIDAKGDTAKGLIRIETRQDGGDVEIRIADSGTGIPQNIQSRIFDPFFTTKAIGKGSGQGLAIARSIVVDKHNGAITFATGENQGTTFIIRLPVNSGEHTTTADKN